MVSFDTTATTQGYAWLYEGNPNTPGKRVQLRSSAGADQRILMAFRMPDKPSGGVDKITKTKLTFTVRFSQGSPSGRIYNAYRVSQLWIDADSNGTATWNRYSTGNNWSAAGGDLDAQYGISPQPGLAKYASFSIDVTSLNLDWSENAAFIIRDSSEDGAGAGFDFFGEPGDFNATSTYAFTPMIVVSARDDAPEAINNLHIHPDTSLSEASYTFRQRAVLCWKDHDA